MKIKKSNLSITLSALWFFFSFIVGFIGIIIAPNIEAKLLGVVIMVYAIVYAMTWKDDE